MKVAVEDITETSTRLEEDIDAGLWEMDSFDIKFLSKINLTCTFMKSGKDILVDAEVTTHRQITCSRCLEVVEQALTQHFDFHYAVAGVGKYLEMDKDIREQVLLNFPMKVLCKADCRGICPHCGTNLNRQKCQCQESLQQ